MSKISIQNVSYVYETTSKKHAALRDVNLEIAEGEFVCVVGHSGCGKTTLLNIISGLIPATGGAVYIDGKPVEGPGIDRSVVFQHYSLFPWLTVKKNVIFGIRQARPTLSKREREMMAMEFLRHVELNDVMDKYPHELSGGMQQRVAIARAFAMDADIMLLDEPFGALDPRIRYTLQEMLERLWREAGSKKTVVFVTHDIEEAIVMADRILFMQPGSISTEMAVDFSRPRNRREIMQMPECCVMRKELIEMFYVSQEKEKQNSGGSWQ